MAVGYKLHYLKVDNISFNYNRGVRDLGAILTNFGRTIKKLWIKQLRLTVTKQSSILQNRTIKRWNASLDVHTLMGDILLILTW